MRRRLVAGLALLGLATGGTALLAPAPALASTATPTTVLTEDFEDGAYTPLVQNGGGTLSLVPVEGGTALRVSGRANDYDGVKTPGGLLQPGTEYAFSLRARLADGTPGSAGVRFVVEPSYTWVGATSMTADAWTTVTGTFTAPAGADPATLRAYIGTGDLGAAYDYLVDDLVITAAAQEPATVADEDFEDGDWAPWTQSGGPQLSVVDSGGGKVLQVAGRTNDYDGLQSPTGLLQPGGTYALSMRARLAPGGPASAGVRFVVKPSYTWVGATTMTADAWTTVSGSFTVPTDADPAVLQVYLGTADTGAPYTYLVDDLLITGGSGGGSGDDWEPTPDPDFVPGGAVSPTTTPLARARGTGSTAALTIDDGPNPGETDAVLDLLAAQDVTAVFCVIGQNVTAPGGAELLRRIVAEGHTLCNHGTTYADMGSWTRSQVEADLKANLEIIRTALGDPTRKVPYFRAPNGSWGRTGEVAAALGMQPLGLGNVIFDWDGNDLSEATLTENLREAFTPGAVVLVHDGGGDRSGTVAALETVIPEQRAAGWQFTLPAGGVPGGEVALQSDFEDGLQGWVARAAQGSPTVATTTAERHGGQQAALVSGRTGQGDGIGHDVTGLLTPGVTYEISAWVKMAAGVASDDVWMTVQRTTAGADAFDTVGQFSDITSGEWRQVTATYQAPDADRLFLYLETSYNTGSNGDFLVDDVVVRSQPPLEVQPLTPLRDTTAFPVGVAIDSRETSGAAGQLTLRHFDQITGENHMKPEAWYDAERRFRTHPEATALMQFAQAEGLRVYGHTLVWHSQTPAWFFTDAAGAPLTTSEEHKQLLRDRLRTHVFAVAEALSTGGGYGHFGSPTNPLVAFDVVNEVIADTREHADGMRRSEWYRVLGEEFVDLAFRYADEAFNGTYAVEGPSRPVVLTINDYNTEQVGKQQRLHALVERLLARGVPVDAVGHQFHVSLAMPVQALDDALDAFADLPVQQVVTELDVTTGTPVTEARLVEQGYYYRDAFRVFREHAADLFSVTVWGLTDGRSWRVSNGAPLLFDDRLQAKPAYDGAVDAALPPRQVAEVVHRGSVALDDSATTSPEWARLPLHRVGSVAGLQLRWEPDHLTAYVRVDDATAEPADALAFTVGGTTSGISRSGATTGGATGVVSAVEGGWAAVVHLPLTGAEEGGTVPFDVAVTDGATTTRWASAEQPATLTLVEPLSFVRAVQAPSAPAVDGAVDPVWRLAPTVTTGKQLLGTGTATAAVRTLWRDDTLYVLAEVTDDVIDTSGTDPWTQDSVELFVDAGNVKNGPYRYDDTQIRISATGATSFGTGDEAFQEARLTSAVRQVAGGYVVEAAVTLLEEGGLGTFSGFDVQVNDAEGGQRVGIRTWADPTTLGYQSTERWGVVELGPAPAPPGPRTRADCKDGAWQQWTSPSYRNQGQCVSAVSRSGAAG